MEFGGGEGQPNHHLRITRSYIPYKWSYIPYECPYKWVTGVTTSINRVITLLMTGSGGPPCRVDEHLLLSRVSSSNFAKAPDEKKAELFGIS